MNSKQIEQYLGFLGQKLEEIQIKATIILFGGALMITQIGNRKSTQDIDIVIATNNPATYRAIQKAVALITFLNLSTFFLSSYFRDGPKMTVTYKH